MADMKVGSRIMYMCKLKGVIRFIGETKFSKGILYGIELDTPDGKTDGTLYSVKYFECKENCGIFVRRSQISELRENEGTLNNSDKIVEKPINIMDEKKQIANINMALASQEKENKMLPPKSRALIPTSVAPDNRKSTMLPKPNAVKNQDEIDKPILKREIWRNSTALIDTKEADMKKDYRDLMEKFETLQILKKKDREMLKESEKSRKLLEMDFEKLREETRQLEQERDGIRDEFARYKDSMRSVEDDIEMAAIDKEMAEEKLDQLTLEYEALKEECAKLKTGNGDCQVNRESSEAPADQSVQLQKYEKAIVEMRNTIISLKARNESQEAELEILRELQVFQDTEIQQLKATNFKMEKDVAEMKDLVDSTADTENIVDNLTFENQSLEIELKKQKKRLLELDTLEDTNTKIIEEKNSEIRELRQEIECSNLIVYELRETLNAKNTKKDENADMNKKLQEDILKLKTNIRLLEDELRDKNQKLEKSVENYRRYSVINYKQQNSARSDVLKVIEDKLRVIDLGQKSKQILLLYKFLPVTFCSVGGPNDLISVVLLLDRLLLKVSFTLEHIDKQSRSDFHENYYNESSSFKGKLQFLLTLWMTILRQLKINLDRGEKDVLVAMALSYHRLGAYEARIDFVVDLVKRDCLSGNRNLDDIVDCISFFQHFYEEKFRSKLFDCDVKMNGFITAVYKGSQCLKHDLNWLESLITSNKIQSIRLIELVTQLKNIFSEMQSKLKSALVSIQNNQPIGFDIAVSRSIDDTIGSLMKVVETISDYSVELSDDKISNEEFISRLLEIFSKHKKRNELVSVQELVDAIKSIDNATGSISENFKNGLYDIDKMIVRVDTTSIDQSAYLFREKWLKLQNLSTEIKLRDNQLQILTKDTNEKSEKLNELNLQVDFYRNKLDKTIESRDLEIKSLNQKLLIWQKSERKEDASKSADLEIEVSRLTQQLKELKDSPSCHTSIGSSHSNNGYKSEIQDLFCQRDFYRHQLYQHKAKQYQDLLSKLKPLEMKIAPQIAEVNQMTMNAEQLRSNIYKTVSSMKIPDLSQKQNKAFVLKLTAESFAFKAEFEKLKKNSAKYFDRKDMGINLAVVNTSTNLLGRIKFGDNQQPVRPDKCVQIDVSSMKMLENLFNWPIY